MLRIGIGAGEQVEDVKRLYTVSHRSAPESL